MWRKIIGVILIVLSVAVTAAVLIFTGWCVIDAMGQEYTEGIEMFAAGVGLAVVLFFDVFVLGNVWGTYASIRYFLCRRSGGCLWRDVCHVDFLIYHFIMILTAVFFFPSHGFFDPTIEILVIFGVFVYVPARIVYSCAAYIVDKYRDKMQTRRSSE